MDLNEEEFFQVEGKIDGKWKRNHQKHDDLITAQTACKVFENARDIKDTRIVRVKKIKGKEEEVISDI